MPRDSDKNNDSRGRRDRPGAAGPRRRARAARGRRGGRRRNSPSAGLPARVKATASGVPMPGSPTARSRSARSLIPAVGKPYAGKRDGDDRPPRRDFGDAPRPRGDRPFAGRPSRGDDGEKRSFKPREDRGGGDKRPFKPRGDRPNFNRDDARPARAFFRQEIWRQEALYPARRWRREAALYAAWRRFSQGRRPSARRSALQRPAVA